MFIRLTRWKEYIDLDDTVYLNPLTITAIRKGESYTNVNTIDGGSYKVAETPEEIINQFGSATKHYVDYLGLLKR